MGIRLFIVLGPTQYEYSYILLQKSECMLSHEVLPQSLLGGGRCGGAAVV